MINLLRSTILLAIVASLFLGFTGCGEDEVTTDPIGAQVIEVSSSQAPDNGQVLLSKVVSAQAGWVVIHRDNGSGGPTVPGIIGKAQVVAGTNTDVRITLDSTVRNGEVLWAMLHVDDGQIGTYEFTGGDSPDQPAMEDGAIVMKSFTIAQTDPSVDVADQQEQNNSVIISSVNSPENGFIVIHASNANGNFAEVVGKAPVQAGTNQNVTVTLDQTNTVRAGNKLWAMLHYDRGTEGTYEFPGADVPVIFDGAIVMKSFIVTGADPSLNVIDQSGGTSVTITSANVSGPAWVVIHKDNGNNGPVVPGIIGKTRLYNGMNTNVQIQLSETVGAGTKLWAMLHYDTGVIGSYEFDGANGLDSPIIVNDNIQMQSFLIQ